MKRVLFGVLGLTAYAAFLSSFGYFIGFVNGAVVPKTIDSGPSGSLLGAAAIDLALIAFFGFVHSIMAAGEASVIEHRGPYRGLARGHAALRAWCSANARTIGAYSLEIYGDWSDDPRALETTIQYLLL